MSVLKIVIVSLVFVKLFAVDLYVPQNYKKNININGVNVKKYKSVKEVNFTNALGLISYNEIPLIFEKNLSIITPIGDVKEYILTRKKSLEDIKSIINLDFSSKILLDSVNGHYKSVKGNLKDFWAKKADAIVCEKDIDKPEIFDFPLSLYGIEFNKYFIVSSIKFAHKHHKLIEKLNTEFEKKLNFHKKFIYKTLLLSGLYLHKHIDFNRLLFENYKLNKEKNEEFLIVDVTPNWPPFDIYKNGHLYGIGVDFWKLIAKKAKLKYKFKLVSFWPNVLKDIKEKKADLTINTSETSDRKKYALFTKPYVSFPLAVICRDDEDFHSINEIKSLAVGKNYTAEKLMKKHYPNLNYIETKTTFDALKLVENKKADCAVDILPTILWIINKNHIMNMQIAFKTPFKFNVQIMVRNDKPDLVDILNKTIDKISPEEKTNIVNSYIGTIIVEQNHKPNIVFILIVVGIVILAILILYIKSKKNIEKIEKIAEYDELTNILNRRGVLERLKDVKKGAVLFFDIDHFKKINDTYGHEFGDYVLKEIGKILKSTFRKSDIVGRWGGEEFIVILPDTDYEVGLKLAEKLRKTIEKYYFKGIHVTVSIGVSEYSGNLEEDLKKADVALYEAKNSGRNQVKGSK